MYGNTLLRSALITAAVMLSYTGAQAQVPDTVKDAASKTKEATVSAAKKTKVVVTDTTDKVVDKSKSSADAARDTAAAAAKATASKTKKIGNYSVDVTDSASGQAYEGGKYLTTSTWDGSKWVSKRVWYETKKGASATKDAAAGDQRPKP